MEQDLISVIVPIYKVEKYLKRCIDSIINQTYKNLQIILVDDGSPDRCGKICDEYSKKDKRIKVIHKKNGGLSDARNKGLDVAEGKYIGFVDSDDYIDERMYEVLYNNLKDNNADLSICSIYEFKNDKEIVEGYNKKQEILVYKKQEMFNKFYENLLRNVVAWNKLYKKELFENIRYPKGKAIEDSAIIHYIINQCDNIVVSNLELYFYFQREESIIHAVNDKLLDELEFIYDKVKFFKENNYQNEKIYNDNIGYYINKYIGLYTIFSEIHKINKNNLAKHKKILRTIIKEYRYNSRKQKIKFNLFLIMPNIYCFIKKIKKKADEYKYNIFVKKSNKNLYKKYEKYCAENKRKFIIFNAPNHGNLGDHAILIAEEKMLKDCGINPFSITSHNTECFINNLLDTVNKEDVIFITGGGNLGTIWEHEQLRVNTVIEKLKDNKIIVFPQTIYYNDDRNGIYARERDYKIYKSCRDITLCCRDEKSFEFVNHSFKGIKSKYVPDIVTYLDNIISKEYNRKNISFCFREDIEKSLNNEETKKIIEILQDKYKEYSIRKINTVPNSVPGKYGLKKGKKEIIRLLKKVKKSKLLVTDRLHAMIFATITNTPCIAFGNKSGKVKGVYAWISKDNEYIKFANSIEEFKDIIDQIDLNKKYYYKNEDLKKKLINIIEGVKNGKN